MSINKTGMTSGSWNKIVFLKFCRIIFILIPLMLAMLKYTEHPENDWTVATGLMQSDDDFDSIKNQLLFSDLTDFSAERKTSIFRVIEYRIQSGDTLSAIARKNGVSMDTIVGCSGLQSYNVIKEGQLLRIPDRDGLLHTVKKNQSLSEISEKYGISVQKITAANGIENADFIQPGSEIFIPDAKPQNIISGFIRPVPFKRITSAFGWRFHPVHKRNKYHSGIDIPSHYQWVKNTKYGKVTYAGWLGGYGYAVIIAHEGGWKSLYGHLSKIIVRKGQYIKQGQVIARSGNSGITTGPHLHFELIRNGKHVNPLSQLK